MKNGTQFEIKFKAGLYFGAAITGLVLSFVYVFAR